MSALEGMFMAWVTFSQGGYTVTVDNTSGAIVSRVPQPGTIGFTYQNPAYTESEPIELLLRDPRVATSPSTQEVGMYSPDVSEEPITYHSTWPGAVPPGTDVVPAVRVGGADPYVGVRAVVPVLVGPGAPSGFYGDVPIAPVASGAAEIDLDNIVGLPVAVATALRALGMARLVWNMIPGWAKVVLIGLGVVAGTTLLIRRLTGGGGEMQPGGGPPGVQVVGSWVANGVRFYRLADGRLAVQNTRGRWKLWRPKKPIVLMPTGATNLRTLLRADAVLNRQARKIANMLNRRAGTRRSARPRTLPPGSPTQIVQRGG